MRIHACDDVNMLYAEDDLLREDSYEGEGSRYKITYEGYIFDGDTNGLNVHYLEDWSNVASILNCYGDCIMVEDLISGAVWEDGEWYV